MDAARKLDDTSTVDGGVVEDAATKRARKAAEQGDDIDKQIGERVEMESLRRLLLLIRTMTSLILIGVAFHKDKSFEVLDNLNRIDTDPNQVAGSAGNLFTAAQKARFARSAGDARKVMIEVATDIIGDARTKKLIADATDVDDLQELLYSLRRTGEIVSVMYGMMSFGILCLRTLRSLLKTMKL